MFGLNRSFLDRDVEDWHIECWAWLIRCGGGVEQLRESALILPSRDHFPPTDLKGHNKAKYIFDIVLQYCGMQNWPVKLQAQRGLAHRVATFGVVQNPGVPAGTFQSGHGTAQITYAPEDVSDPVSLIATFAHELGHYLQSGFQEGPPGGWDLHEPATDVASAYLGFGVFGANSAFHFTRTQDFESQGWSTAKRGYLTEAEWVLALAIFCAFVGEDIAAALPHLKPHLAKQAVKASKYVERNTLVDRIEALL